MKKEGLVLSKLLHRKVVRLLQSLSILASLKCLKNIVENILTKWECMKQTNKKEHFDKGTF